MRLTTEQLLKSGYRKNADGSWSKPNLLAITKPPIATADAAPVDTEIPRAESEHNAASPLWPTGQAQEGRRHRVTVRITSRRTRLLDTDNSVASGKFLLDQLRYHGLIPEDDPQTLELISRQEKVKTPEQTGTMLEIIYHDQTACIPEILPLTQTQENPNQ